MKTKYRVTYTQDSKRYGQQFEASTHAEVKQILGEKVAKGDRLTLEKMQAGYWQAEINREVVIADVWAVGGAS